MLELTACLDSLKSSAIAALEAFSAAARAANSLPSSDDRLTAYRQLPKRDAVCGGVSVKAIVPENRTAWRARHVRFQFRVAGKLVPEVAALTALQTGAR